MAIRSATKLAADQANLLASYRAKRPPQPVGGAPVTPSPPALHWGKVTSVVTADPDYGPHLMVQGQTPTGTPPTFSATAAPPFRCYPAPGKTVADYAVDDYVRLTPTATAMFAEPLA
jgi:hypothetical protein